MEGERILYLDSVLFEDAKALRGGALVVDRNTEPLEFRCTSAVRPTLLQRILWGARLDGHIAAALLGRPLIRSLEQGYSVVVIRNPDFFEIRGELQVPLILVNRDVNIELEYESSHKPTERVERPDDSGGKPPEFGEEGASDVLTNPTGRFEPVILRCDPKHEEDLQAARSLLAPVFSVRDVLEPFERIANALEAIQVEETKESVA